MALSSCRRRLLPRSQHALGDACELRALHERSSPVTAPPLRLGGAVPTDPENCSTAFSRRAVAFFSIRVNCSPRPACKPHRLGTTALTTRPSTALRSCRSSAQGLRKSPVKSPPRRTQAARNSANAPLVMQLRTTKASGDPPFVDACELRAPHERSSPVTAPPLRLGGAGTDPENRSTAFSRRAAAFFSIRASCSSRPACLPIRTSTPAVTILSSHCIAKLSISRSRSRNSPVKSPPRRTQAARNSANAPLVMHWRTARASGDEPASSPAPIASSISCAS